MTDGHDAPTPSKGSMRQVPFQDQGSGFAQELVEQLKLSFRLLIDSRVNLLLRGLTFLGGLGSLIYILSPDPMPGPLDDITVGGVYYFLTYVFVELSPKWVVREHRRSMKEEEEAPPPQGKREVSAETQQSRATNLGTQPRESETPEVPRVNWLDEYAEASEAPNTLVKSQAKRAHESSIVSNSVLVGLMAGSITTAVLVTVWSIAGLMLATMNILGVIAEGQLTETWSQINLIAITYLDATMLLLAAVWLFLVIGGTLIAFVYFLLTGKQKGGRSSTDN